MASTVRQKITLALLVLAFLLLQGRLWFGEGSVRHVVSLKREIAQQQAKNSVLQERNDLMSADVADLKSGLDAIEEIARRDLGLIRSDETYFLMFDERSQDPSGDNHAAPR